ncbi:PQQ-dependent sugar dehydrogenase [Haloferula sp. BvORR071]|uniref:PQQ-dependent sugar dehydrogenase n=1 Tax=Haloferula sp. BvORR071 TaxID=1396141 RepID=UPI002240F3D1|nr:PQQ-dependent sugar dehydrogenase [Haloferula sp. BvORR071]
MRTAALQTLALALPLVSSAAEIESTFFAPTLKDPIELAPAPDGDIYIVEREGRVLRLRPATGGLFEIGHLEVTALRSNDRDSNWAREDGILGLTLDPGFAKNQRLYIYYSHPKELLNRLSRFELKDGKLDLTSEKVLFDVKTDRRDRVCHHGGSLAFGPDGLLYLSTGDNTNPFESDGFAPQDDRDGHDNANSMRSAGNTNDLRGKVLRIRPTESGGYEIPPGNLFPPGTAKTRPEIYTMGLRNPYRLSIDQKANILYWGEVGPDASNNGPKGPRGHDEVNQAKKAGNFGWPFVIANNKPYAITDFATGKVGPMTDPAAPKNPSKLNTGLVDLPPANPAFIWYPYAKSEEFPAVGEGGRNAMAGPVFYYDSSRKYNLLGKGDDHTLLTYDWIRNKMWKAKLGPNEELVSLTTLMDGFTHPMDLEMAADGTLWMLEYGTEWYFNNDGRVRRLRPADGNKPPEITAKREGETFTATAKDPDGDTPQVDWWLTEGVNERKIGTGPALAVSTAGGSELRAVATDAKGATAIARIPLVEEAAAPALELEVATGDAKQGFGEELAFKVTGQADPAKTVVRARYIPPTGHDAGGPQFPGDIEKLVVAKACFACHQIEKTSVGPAYLDVAMKYRSDSGALSRLQAKVKTGGAGVWGEIPMPPQVAASDAEAEQIIKAILNLSTGIAETRGTAQGNLKLAAQPAGVDGGGAWEITAESPGYRAARKRIPAK